jgi:hypothetical protein
LFVLKQIAGFQRERREGSKTTAHSDFPKQNHVVRYSVPITRETDNKSDQNSPDYIGNKRKDRETGFDRNMTYCVPCYSPQGSAERHK